MKLSEGVISDAIFLANLTAIAMFLPGIVADPHCLGCLSHAPADRACPAHLAHFHWIPPSGPPALPSRQYVATPLPDPPPKPQRMLFRRRDSLPGPPPYQIAAARLLQNPGFGSRSLTRASTVTSTVSTIENANAGPEATKRNSFNPASGHWECVESASCRKSALVMSASVNNRQSPGTPEDCKRRRSVTLENADGVQVISNVNGDKDAINKCTGTKSKTGLLPALRILERNDVLSGIKLARSGACNDVAHKGVQCGIEPTCENGQWPPRRKGPRLRLNRVFLGRGFRCNGSSGLSEQHIPEGVAIGRRKF